MKVVATYHAPTSVSHSIKCTFTNDPTLEHLVVAKTDRLEVFAVLPDGLQLECTHEVWGRITSLKCIPKPPSSQSSVLVTTDHPDPRLFLIDYVPATESSVAHLFFRKTLSLFERGARPTEFFTGAIVDEQGEVAVISTYIGKLKVLEFDRGNIKSESDLSCQEWNILSISFLYNHTANSKVVAILHRDHTQKLLLTSHDLSIAESELLPAPSSLLPELTIRDPDSRILIPVPRHSSSTWNLHGGVLVLGGMKISFYISTSIDRKQKRRKPDVLSVDDVNSKQKQKAAAHTEWPFSEVTAWARVDDAGSRYIIGDSYGRLALLAISSASQELRIVHLGDTSPPTCLAVLPSQHVFLGSHFGDSQLLRILRDKSSLDGSFVGAVDNFTNIAPIVDAVVTDADGSGQPQIITCSGGKSTGSLRVIRSGATFTEVTSMDLPHVFGVWSLKTRFNDAHDSYLLVTTTSTTHVYQLPDATNNDLRLTNVAEMLSGIIADSRTLGASNLVIRISNAQGKSVYQPDSPYVAQVTVRAVVVVNMGIGVAEDRWTPDSNREIVISSMSPSQICLGLTGGRIVLLNIEGDRINQRFCLDFAVEISALTIVPYDPSKFFSTYAVVGFWGPPHVRLFVLGRDGLSDEESVELSFFPRSLLLHNFGDKGEPKLHLLAGQGDGTVVALPFRKGRQEKLGDKKIFPLGDSPVLLTSCSVDGRAMVFASGSRSGIFFWEKNTLQQSPVLLRNVVFACYLNSSFSPSTLVVATTSGVTLGRLQDFDKLHIRTVLLGLDNPTRIAHLPESRAFGVGCIRTEPSKMNELDDTTSSFKIIDDSSFEILNSYPLERDEELTALATTHVEDDNGVLAYICVGSMFYEMAKIEPTRGRIRLFAGRNPLSLSDQRSSPFLHAAIDTRGCVYAVASVAGKLAAAVNTGVILYSLENPPPGTNSRKLVRVAEWNHNYFVTSLVARDNMLILGDAICSVAVLKVVGDKFQTVAKDYGPLWPLCVELYDTETIIGANSDSNIFAFKISSEGERVRLEADGSYRIDDTVNKFLTACLISPPGQDLLSARQIFFTSSGRIGVLIEVNKKISQPLIELQRNLAGIVLGPGGTGHTTWRAPVNSRGRSDAQTSAVGFLDGDFLEEFLRLDSMEAQKVMAGKTGPERLEMTGKEYRTVLELLNSMH